MPMSRSMPNRAALAAAAVLAACVHAPRIDERGMLASARHVLSIDFDASHAARRAGNLARWPGRVGDELRRAPDVVALPAAAADEFARPATLVAAAGSLTANELHRRPNPAALQLPTPHQLGQQVADDLETSLLVVGPWHRPMGEIDDRRHRTRYDDDSPEATWWQRIKRRLRL
jgi:hypothetical protein